MLIAKTFAILRNIPANGRISHPVAQKPVRVATLINEPLFEQMDNAMIHNKTVFLEDKMHDWNWQDGKFRYYTRIAEQADVLLVFEQHEDGRTPFCSQCGAPVTEGCEHQAKTGQGA